MRQGVIYDSDFIMNLFVVQQLLWHWLVGWQLLVRHWSALLALWLSKRYRFHFNLFDFVSNVFALGLSIIGLAFLSVGIVNNLCTNHLYYCTWLYCTAGHYLAPAWPCSKTSLTFSGPTLLPWLVVAPCPHPLALQLGNGKNSSCRIYFYPN